MKFDCGDRGEARYEKKRSWHRWFAWYPVRLADHDCRWLEWMERKGTFQVSYVNAEWSYEYRAIR